MASSSTGRSEAASSVRAAASDPDRSLIDLLVRYLSSTRPGSADAGDGRRGGVHTLLAVCPTSPSVVRAALRAADRAGAPLLYAATLNQVDRDGGYTGWTPERFADVVETEADRMDVRVPVVLGLDHGGPWKKDRHVREGRTYDETLDGVHASLRACIDAGYELLHLDATVDRRLPPGTPPSPRQIADRTIALLRFAEEVRQDRGRPPLAYEVGTEEASSGLDTLGRFRSFLSRLTDGLQTAGLPAPAFVVGDVGTRLDTTGVDVDRARALTEAVQADLGALVKGHYTDDVEDLAAYPLSGVGAANVGPGLAAVERRALLDLVGLEERLGRASGFPEALREAVVTSGRWRKWVDGMSLDRDPAEAALRRAFGSLSEERRRWLVATGSRYVWNAPAVRAARERLYDHVAPYRDGRAFVEWRIETEIARYLHAFHLAGFLDRFRDWLSR